MSDPDRTPPPRRSQVMHDQACSAFDRNRRGDN